MQCEVRERVYTMKPQGPYSVIPYFVHSPVDGRATRGAALMVDLSWTSSAPWECGLVMDLFKTLSALPIHTSSGLPRNW